MSIQRKLLAYLSNVIHFKDINVKEALLASSDINPDGTREITYAEAASVINSALLKAAINPNDNNTDIVSFKEIKYFTNIGKLPKNCFKGCNNLKEIICVPSQINNPTDNSDYSGIFYDCDIEELHLEDFTELIAGASNVTNGNSKFGKLLNLKVIYIPSLTKILGLAFVQSHIPNVEKIVISSVQQWLDIYTPSMGQNYRPTAGSSNGNTVKADLYLSTDLEHPITQITTPTQALSGITTQPTIFEFALEGLKSITDITIGAQNTDVRRSAFRRIPNSVTIHNFDYISKVAADSFYKCKAQGMTNIPSSITNVYENSFRESALQKIESTSLVTISGSNAFTSTPITTIVANNITAINSNSVFYQCTSLISVFLNSLTTFGTSLFKGCNNLQTVSLQSATIINTSSFYQCSKLTTVDAPNVTQIKEEAFYGCSLLSNINFNLSNATIIQERAFLNCSLITAPTDYSNLTYIDQKHIIKF